MGLLIGFGCVAMVGCGSESDDPAGGDASTVTDTTATTTATTTSHSSSVTTSGGTTGGGSTSGVLVDGVCTLLCVDDSTDADVTTGEVDGWGFEGGQSCVVPGGMADTGETCSDPVLATGPANPSTPGSGVVVGGMCRLVCMDDSTDADDNGVTDGWGFEGVSCVVPGGTVDPGADDGEACTPDTPTGGMSTPGGTVDVGGTCFPVCMDDSTDADENGATDGWGWEDEASCVVPGGPQDTGMPCE